MSYKDEITQDIAEVMTDLQVLSFLLDLVFHNVISMLLHGKGL